MKSLKRNWPTLGLSLGIASAACIAAITVSADAPPVLTISALGTNNYSVVITNGIATNNYTLYWTPVIGSPAYPWQFLMVGDQGQTNFTIDGGTVQNAFFRVLVGIDQDGDGIPDWQDAAPNDPNINLLTVFIDNPANGSVVSQ